MRRTVEPAMQRSWPGTSAWGAAAAGPYSAADRAGHLSRLQQPAVSKARRRGVGAPVGVRHPSRSASLAFLLGRWLGGRVPIQAETPSGEGCQAHKGESGLVRPSADHGSSAGRLGCRTTRRVSMHHHTQPDPLANESFPTDPSGLPEAGRPQLLELAPGDTLDLRVGPVAKRLGGDTTVRMLGYNGSIPGPTLKVAQGSEIVVHVTNQGDLDTTVHWHGLRLENKYDGVPHETQAPIPVGGEFTYRIQFPDAGLYWYHPHIREDYTQELGLYGNILVAPAEPDYWPPADREFVVTVDDLLLEDGKVASFSLTETSYAAMGRFGNVFITSGDPDLHLTAGVGEVVRLWLTNTANTRVFNVRLPGARMKLIGGDSGRVEREEFVSEVLLAPSERVVVDVLLDQPGELTLEHRTPDRAYQLATVTVSEERATP